MQESFRDMPDQEADELSAQIEAVSSPRTFTPPPAESATTQLIARLPAPDTLSDQETAPSQKTQPDRPDSINELLLPEEGSVPATEPKPLPAPPATTSEQSPPPPIDLGEEATVPHETQQDVDRAVLESADTPPAHAVPRLIPASSEDSISDELTRKTFVLPSEVTAPGGDILSAETQPPIATVPQPPTGQFAVVAAPPLPPVSPRKLVRAAAFGAGIFICGALFGAGTLGKTYYSNRTAMPQPIAAEQTECRTSQQMVRMALQPPLPCPAPVAPTSAKVVTPVLVVAPSKPMTVRPSIQRTRKTSVPKKPAALAITTSPPAFVPLQRVDMIMGAYMIQTGPDELPDVAKICGLSSSKTILNMMPNSQIIEDAKTVGKPILPPGTTIRVPCKTTELEALFQTGRFRFLFPYKTTASSL